MEKFEELYFRVRTAEKRIYSDEDVKRLPEVKKTSPHFQEWQSRKRSFTRFKKHLQSKERSLNILDVGCGNGWMDNTLASIEGFRITGIDLNGYEIEQANRVFQDKKNVRFIYGSPFTISLPEASFDVIVMAASIQYFPDLKKLLHRLLKLLRAGGEIHILDTHFYKMENIEQARERSRKYYESIGQEEMTSFYFHHAMDDLAGFSFQIMNRSLLERLLLKIPLARKIIFPWIVISK